MHPPREEFAPHSSAELYSDASVEAGGLMCVPSSSVDQNGSVNGAAAPKLAAEMVCCCCALPSVTKLADRASSGSVICEATIFFFLLKFYQSSKLARLSGVQVFLPG